MSRCEHGRHLRSALDAQRQARMGAMLRACGAATALELLQRTTRGEDRQYVYRIPCGATPLLLHIDFNKGACINRLDLRPEADQGVAATFRHRPTKASLL